MIGRHGMGRQGVGRGGAFDARLRRGGRCVCRTGREPTSARRCVLRVGRVEAPAVRRARRLPPNARLQAVEPLLPLVLGLCTEYELAHPARRSALRNVEVVVAPWIGRLGSLEVSHLHGMRRQRTHAKLKGTC